MSQKIEEGTMVMLTNGKNIIVTDCLELDNFVGTDEDGEDYYFELEQIEVVGSTIRNKMKITLDQYVIHCIHSYPGIFHDNSYDQSKWKVLNQLLNVIGNGIINDVDLECELYSVGTDLTMDDIKGFISGETLFYGYIELKNIRGHDFPKIDSMIDDLVLEKDKENFPDVIHWTKSKMNEFTPYPNFKEKYSTVFQCPSFMELDRSFIEGAIEFYEYCLEWFETKESQYHGAFPCATEKETEQSINAMEKMLKRYNSNEEISEAYGVEYLGDVYDFQVRRWQKEKKRVLGFINTTIEFLKTV
jgi:hypothetical protein